MLQTSATSGPSQKVRRWRPPLTRVLAPLLHHPNRDYRGHIGIIGYILGLYRDNGKYGGNSRDYRGYMGILGYMLGLYSLVLHVLVYTAYEV